MEDILEKIRKSLQRNRLFDLRETLKTLHPEDIAGILERLDEEEKKRVFSELDPEVAADVLLELEDETLRFFLTDLTEEEISELTEEMAPEEAADIVAELPVKTREEVLELIPEEISQEVRTLLQYPENTAGGIMSLDFVALPADSTISEGLSMLRKIGEDVELSYVYVTDQKERLVGVLPLRKLLVTRPEVQLREIMIREPVVAYVEEDQEEVVRRVTKHDLLALPIVDSNKILRGVVKMEDVMDVIEEEATEDILRMGGTAAEESIFTPPFKSLRNRLPWLSLNLFLAFVAASVVGLFIETIAAVAVIAVFLPIVAGLGGNTGIQTLVVIVRGLALGEVTLKDTWRILLKEFAVGLLMGLVIGILTALVTYFWKGNPVLGLVVGIALVVNMIAACLAGAAIPLTLKGLRLDPALGSGIFLTTITDVVGFLTFLGLATFFLKFLQ
ncbi:magnesium transporter [candidate division TA06 bacterium]|nr:magnesium transporter [candidate division TA06 bacterium]